MHIIDYWVASTGLGGALLACSMYDGRVSFYGMVFKILSFVVTGLTIFCDPQLTKSAKFSYGLPKIVGLYIIVHNIRYSKK